MLSGTISLADATPSDEELLAILRNDPDGMILTVSKAATATINRIAVQNLFLDTDPCGQVVFDNDDGLQPLYKGLKVIITQNRNKQLHVVKWPIFNSYHNAKSDGIIKVTY